MAHKKAGGSSRNGRDSESKRLGLKAFGGAVTEGDQVVGVAWRKFKENTSLMRNQ